MGTWRRELAGLEMESRDFGSLERTQGDLMRGLGGGHSTTSCSDVDWVGEGKGFSKGGMGGVGAPGMMKGTLSGAEGPLGGVMGHCMRIQG